MTAILSYDSQKNYSSVLDKSDNDVSRNHNEKNSLNLNVEFIG